MSHIPQRKEKNCLNCGTIVQGPYCHNCGQENIVPHESFWHMAKHFFYDITHFDSKFFDTLKDLLLRPGFLSKEYVSGRRARYLNPIKMYVFTSAVFFLLFFSLFQDTAAVKTNLDTPMTQEEIAQETDQAELDLKNDSANVKLKEMLQLLRDTTRKVTRADLINYYEDFTIIDVGTKKFKSVKEYDSVQSQYPASQRDGWLEKRVMRKIVGINEKYRDDPAGGFTKLRDGFLHKLPYLLFVSLPLFALFLKLLYIRRKNFFYFDHGIFSIHHYIFTFILLFVVFALQKLSGWLGMGIFDIAAVFLFLSGGFYLYKSMRKFYGQRRAKTVIKFLLLNIMGFIGMILLFAIFVVFSVFEL